MMLGGHIGFLAEPATDVRGLGRGIVEPAFEQCRVAGFGILGVDNGRRRVDAACSRSRRAATVALGEIGLGDDDAVGDRDLLDRLDMAVERRLAVHRIDQRDDAVEPIGLDQRRMTP